MEHHIKRMIKRKGIVFRHSVSLRRGKAGYFSYREGERDRISSRTRSHSSHDTHNHFGTMINVDHCVVRVTEIIHFFRTRSRETEHHTSPSSDSRLRVGLGVPVSIPAARCRDRPAPGGRWRPAWRPVPSATFSSYKHKVLNQSWNQQYGLTFRVSSYCTSRDTS